MPQAPYLLQGHAIWPLGMSLKNIPSLGKVLLPAFNVLRGALLPTTAYAELSKNHAQEQTCGNGHHLLRTESIACL